MNPDQITSVVGEMSDFILRYAVALAAVGALSMAILEAWKKIVRTKERFHMTVLQQWFYKTGDILGEESTIAYQQLIHLCTGVPIGHSGRSMPEKEPKFSFWSPRRIDLNQASALYTLPLEKMMGQVQEAADTVLSTPREYLALYRFLTLGASQSDVDAWLKRAEEPIPSEKASKEEAKSYADLYARLRQLMRRRLDAFQLICGHAWTNTNQWYANVLGFILLFISLLLTEGASEHPRLSEPYVLVSFALIAIVGGMLAPIAKDLVVALKKVRGGV